MSATTETKPANPNPLDRALVRATMIYVTVAASGVAMANLIFGGLWGTLTLFAASGFQSNTLLFIAQDAPVGAFMAVCTWLLIALPQRVWDRPARWIEAAKRARLMQRPGVICAGLALAAFVLAYLGRYHVHHGIDFVGDEYLPYFQGRIFAEGRLLAPIDPAWAAYAEALQPIFAHLDLANGLWGSTYRPGHAMLRAVAIRLGDDALLNPILSAASVLLMAQIARVTFPERRFAPLLAACLLLTSAQFLGLAVAGFSYSAHLFFCLLWLALFLRADLVGHLAAALVGAFAIGLHQIHIHPLFAAPFLLAHLFGHFGRSWLSLLAYTVAYLAGFVLWIFWNEIATAVELGDLGALPGLMSNLTYLRGYDSGTVLMRQVWHLLVLPEMWVNVLRLLAWLSPAILVLAPMALLRWRTLPLTVRLASWGVILMIAAHAVLMPVQAHSWGYRYAHPIVGNLVLLAVAGFPWAAAEARRTGPVVGALLLVSAFVLVPWRAAQIEARIAPRAAALATINAMDADVVLLDEDDFWYGVDLIHNDPFLRQRPLVMSTRRLTPEHIEALSALRVRQIGQQDLLAAGLNRGDWLEPKTTRWDSVPRP